jgi:FAD/FMN-containing dehydrogenase
MTTTSLAPERRQLLADRFGGDLTGPEDIRYEELRRCHNGMIDKRPALLASCRGAADVARAVRFANAEGLEIAVRGGGHSIAGFSTVDDGLVLDLSAMNAVNIDAGARIAWAQTGVTAGGYTSATSRHGLATGLGDTASVGLGGITLGGGIGFLVRKHGLAIDDVLAAEIVTADGALRQVDEHRHPDLFWALRGGGGNVGVVTRLALRLHEVDHVVGGILVLPASADVITGLVAAADAAPEGLSIIANILNAPPLPDIAAEQYGKPVVMVQMVYAGMVEAGEQAIAPLRALATPLADMVRPIRYQDMFAGPEGPRPAFAAGTNILVDDLPAHAAETILEHLERATTTALAAVQLRVLGGAMARVPADATAFGHRSKKLMVNVAVMDQRTESREEHEAWAAGLVAALSDGAAPAAYVGFVGDEGDGGVRRAYPAATLRRLSEVKRSYDPGNLFRVNVNVRPR